MTTTAPHRRPLSHDVLAVMGSALPAPYDRGMERLDVPLGDRVDGTIAVPGYDFGAYEQRYGRPPEQPRYLLAPGRDITAPLTVRVLYRRAPRAKPEHVDVTIPAGRSTGSALPIPLPSATGDIARELRLVGLRPHDPAGAFDDVTWTVTALLGNLAKLLWVIGAEHEEIAWQLRDVTAQRNTHTAHGASLDLLGLDLGAPRFPPRPHTPDSHTLALFHLDESPPVEADGLRAPEAEVAEVVDAAAPEEAARRGTNDGAHSGRTGRFSRAFGFGPGPGGISVPHSPHFDLPATAPFTVEAVIRPDRVTATGALVAKRALLNVPESAGWALAVGTFRGIDCNLRLSLSDGSREVDLFADRDLGDGAFHHIAGVVDRQGTTVTALLYVDGTEMARRVTGGPLDDPGNGDDPEDPGTALGALTSPAPLVMGQGTERRGSDNCAAPYRGLLEEVRLSRLVRATFEPVTGESDEQYSRRLRIFHRWLLPTPANLQDAVNTAVESIAAAPDDPAPFEVGEPGDRGVSAGHPLRVLPETLPVSQSLTADGDQGTTEASAVGTAGQDEPDFDPAWLTCHPDRQGLTFAGGGDSRMMQLVVVRALDALVVRLAAQRPPPVGTLRVLKAYDATGAGLHTVGRAVLLAHDTLASENLAALAHAAGFGWVEHTRDHTVYASQPRGEVLRVTSTTDPAKWLPDVREGESLDLGIEPDLSHLPDAEVRWTVLRPGAGDAAFRPDRPGTLLARAAGDVSVRVEIVRRGHVASGTRSVRIGLPDTSLTAGHSISRTGRRDTTEADDAGPPTTDFDPNMLQVRTDDLAPQPAPVVYGKADTNRVMQRATSDTLDRLLALLDGTPGELTVLTSYVPATGIDDPPAGSDDPPAENLRTQGRALVLHHATLSAPALAARAFDAGFDHIEVASAPAPGAPETVHVAVAAGEQPVVDGPDELMVGQSARVAAEPAAEPATACFSADGSFVYLAEPGSHRITSLTLRKPESGDFPRIALATSRPVAPFPGDLAFGGGHLFVAHEPLDRVSVLDPVELNPAAPDITGSRPAAVATDANRLYVGFGGDRPTLRAYLLTTGQEAASLELPAAPRSITVAPAGPSLYVVVGGGRWCRVKRATLTLEQTVATGDAEASTSAVTRDGSKLYVACPGTGSGGGGRIRVYRPPAQQPVATLEGFPEATVPAALSLGGDGSLLYVATKDVVTEDPASEDSATPAGRVHLVDVATDIQLPQALGPGRGGSALAASPAGTPYRPCFVMAPRSSGTVLLADPSPLGENPPSAPRLVAELPLGTGAGEQATWSSTPDDHGVADFAAPTAPVSTVTGVTPGRALIRKTFLRVGGLRPYQCEIRLKPTLEAGAGSLTKEQYDLILNILNWFHPVGVECRTDRLRLLAGLTAGGADLFPVYTLPTYHVADPLSSPLIHLRKDGRDG
ncbi:LamG-like jellyroll fold domain-containing protein [Streptomyces sp. NPDC005406]|uniref:LamG-like jellyroll fold domain-containing protein n=1 Tax=Streptomyces sp. NPDC005406 TaxID=3155339 RepID=UPI003453C9E2